MSSITTIILPNLVFASAACLHGTVGFGLTLFAAPLLFILNPDFVPGPAILAAFTLVALMCIVERQSLSIEFVKWPAIGQILGAILGAVFLGVISSSAFQLFFGALVLIVVAMSLRVSQIKRTRISGTSAGFLSGFMGVTTSIGGTFIALFYQDLPADKVRANLSTYFLFSIAFAILTLYFFGELRSEHFVLFASIVPGLLIGFLISRFIVFKYQRLAIKRWILTIAAIAGVVTFFSGLPGVF